MKSELHYSYNFTTSAMLAHYPQDCASSTGCDDCVAPQYSLDGEFIGNSSHMDEGTSQSITSAEPTTQDSNPPAKTTAKGKRAKKAPKPPKEDDPRLAETFIHDSEEDVAVYPSYLVCASCKQVVRLAEFITKRENNWSVTKSCLDCCAKGLKHYEAKKRQKKAPAENVLGDKLKPVPGGWQLKTQDELSEEFKRISDESTSTAQRAYDKTVEELLAEPVVTHNVCPQCTVKTESTVASRPQRTVQGAKRKIPIEFDYTYSLTQ